MQNEHEYTPRITLEKQTPSPEELEVLIETVRVEVADYLFLSQEVDNIWDFLHDKQNGHQLSVIEIFGLISDLSENNEFSSDWIHIGHDFSSIWVYTSPMSLKSDTAIAMAPYSLNIPIDKNSPNKLIMSNGHSHWIDNKGTDNQGMGVAMRERQTNCADEHQCVANYVQQALGSINDTF